MTSLEMQGVSLSVLPLIHNNDNGTSSTSSSLLLLARLDAPTSAPAWHPPSPLPPRPPLPQTLASAASLPDGAASALDDQDGKASSALPAMFSAAVLAACQALDASEAELTRWDQVSALCSFFGLLSSSSCRVCIHCDHDRYHYHHRSALHHTYVCFRELARLFASMHARVHR